LTFENRIRLPRLAAGDLEDFFPAMIHSAEHNGEPNITYKLSANINLGYIPTTMTTNSTDAFY
jgi:hypothetical protein